MIKWTERDWAFGYSLEYLPIFIERLHCAAPRIEEMINNMQDDVLSIRADNHWSVKEHIGHLADVEELHMGRLEDMENGLTILRAADMGNKKTYDADHNQYTAKVLAARFRAERENFISKLYNIDKRYFEVTALHPRLQRQVSITDMLYFVAEHDMQHMAAMAEIIQKEKT